VVDPGSLARYARINVRVAKAKAICATCPVLEPCQAWAMTDPDPAYDLIAGGLDPLERARIRRQRKATA